MLDYLEELLKGTREESKPSLPAVRESSIPEKVWKPPLMKRRAKRREDPVEEVKIKMPEPSFRIHELPRQSFD